MGDIRFQAPYQRVKRAASPVDELRLLGDEEVIAALAAAGLERDPYIANVLTTEAQNRISQYSAIVTTMADGVFAVGPMGRLSFMNAAAERVLGWTFAEARGMDMDALLSATAPDAHGAWKPLAICATTLQVLGSTHDDETLFTRRDGSRFPVAYTAAPILREGDPQGAVVVFRDITERRRTEDAVRRLAAIVQSSDDSILSLALDGTILTWNPRAEEIYGYPATYAIGKHATLVVPPELRDAYRRILARVGAGETVRHHETQRIRRGGKMLDISLTAAPIRNARGDVVAISWIGHDITEAKHHEEELQRSERRYRLLLDSVTDHAIFTLDARGYVTSWNPAAQRIKLWKEEEIVGWHYSILFPPEEVASGDPWKELEVAAKKGRFTGEERRIKKNGDLFDASVTLSAMRDDDGTLVGFVKVTRDVGARKEWERRAMTGEARHDVIFQLHPDAIAWHDGNGCIASANEAMASLLRFPSKQELDTRLLQSIAAPDDYDKVDAVVKAALEGKPGTVHFRAFTKDGDHMPVRCRLTPIMVGDVATGFFSLLTAEEGPGPRSPAEAAPPTR